jgi:hypothetical protein
MPPPPHRPVPTDLVGQCIKCLQKDHVTTESTSRPAVSGVAARVIKQGSASVLGNQISPHHCHRDPPPPHRPQRPVWVAVLNPREGDVALAMPQEHRSGYGRRSVTPIDKQAASTLEGLPSYHTLPSPSPPPLLGVLSHHPRFELWVLPRTPAVNTMN